MSSDVRVRRCSKHLKDSVKFDPSSYEYMSVMLLGVQRVVAALVLGANMTNSDAVFDGFISAILRA